MNVATVLLITKILDIILVGAQITLEARREAQAINKRVREMLDSGEGPTVEELAEIEAHTEALIAQIKARVDASDDN